MEKGIYYKGGSQEFVDCELMLKDKSLYIYLLDGSKDLLIWKLDDSTSCQFNGTTLIVSKAPGSDRLECSGDIAYRISEAKNIPEQIVASHRRPLVSYTPFFITCIVIIAIALLGYFVFLPWLGRQLVGLIPTSVEVELGDALSKQYSLQYKTSDSANYYANKFCGQLQLNTAYPIHVEVLQSEELNAFALPGGHIFIYSGMLKKLNSSEELAALLGHEASHVIHRHSLKSILRSAAAGIVISAVFGNFSEMSAWVLSKADEFKQLDYSRELETEADDEGFKLMVQNKIDPNGMLRLLELLKKENTEMPGMMKYLSTHPDTEERIENIKSKADLSLKFSKNEKLDRSFKHLASVCKDL
jgi:predicted Zn-dependent protease